MWICPEGLQFFVVKVNTLVATDIFTSYCWSLDCPALPCCTNTSPGPSEPLFALRGEPAMERRSNTAHCVQTPPTWFLKTCCLEIRLSLSMSVMMIATIRLIMMMVPRRMTPISKTIVNHRDT